MRGNFTRLKSVLTVMITKHLWLASQQALRLDFDLLSLQRQAPNLIRWDTPGWSNWWSATFKKNNFATVENGVDSQYSSLCTLSTCNLEGDGNKPEDEYQGLSLVSVAIGSQLWSGCNNFYTLYVGISGIHAMHAIPHFSTVRWRNTSYTWKDVQTSRQ